MPLSFPNSNCGYDFDRGTINFEGFDGPKRVLCSVSDEALQDHFGARGIDQAELRQAYLAGASLIHLTASRKYDAQGRPASVLLGTADF